MHLPGQPLRGVRSGQPRRLGHPEGVEHEGQLQGVAGAEPGDARGPGELVEEAGRRPPGPGEPPQRVAQQPVGEQVPGEVGRPGLRQRGTQLPYGGPLLAAAQPGQLHRERAEPVQHPHRAGGGQPEPVLLGGPPQQQRYVRPGGRRRQVGRERGRVGDQAEGGPAGQRARPAQHGRLGGEQTGQGGGGEGGGGRLHLQQRGHAPHHRAHPVAGQDLRRAALQGRAGEEASRARGGEQRAGADGPGGLAEDGDPAGIAAERPDVVADPLQGGDLVQQAPVGGGVGEGPVTEDAEAVVEGDEHDPVAGEGRAVVDRHGGRSPGQGPAVDPDHDGQPGTGVRGGGPHVEVQAALAGDLRIGQQRGEGRRVGHLGGRRTEGAGVAYAVPGLGGRGRREAQGADGRGGVRDAPEDGGAVGAGAALDHAPGGLGPGSGAPPGAVRSTHAALPSFRTGALAGPPGRPAARRPVAHASQG